MDINDLTKDQLEDMQGEKETELRLSMDALNVVELRDIELARQIAIIQLDRKNLAAALTQAKYTLRRISSELRSIKCLIFKRLSEGR